MNKVFNVSNLMAVVYAVIAVITGFILFKTTAGMTSLVGAVCGLGISLLAMIVETIYFFIIRETKPCYLVPKIIGAVVGAVILAITL